MAGGQIIGVRPKRRRNQQKQTQEQGTATPDALANRGKRYEHT
jgi:hypothetical protein